MICPHCNKLVKITRKPGGGAKPYGQLPGEAETLSLMRIWRAQGDTLDAIADRLNNQGIPPRQGRKWWPWSVSRILNRQ